MINMKKSVIIVIFAVVLLVLSSCSGKNDDIDYVIGVVPEGDSYTATIDVIGDEWYKLEVEQKYDIAIRCIDTVDPKGNGKDMVINGIEKETGKRLFTLTREDLHLQIMWYITRSRTKR